MDTPVFADQQKITLPIIMMIPFDIILEGSKEDDMFVPKTKYLVGGWLVVLFYGLSNLFGSFNPELNFNQFTWVQV